MLKKTLIQGAKELGIRINESSAALFLTYLEELKRWNKTINLTSITKDRDIIIRHFLDSLTPIKFLKGKNMLLDIGTGAGFPGIPIKILMPEIKVTLIESVEKKVNFLRHIIRTLGLKDIDVVWGRAEDPLVIEKYKNSFECVISRALTNVEDFLTAAMSYVKEKGIIIAMKGPMGEKLEKELTGITFEIHEIKIPFTNQKTSIVIIKP